MKVYASIIEQSYSCGDEHDHNETLIGIYSDPDKASNAGWELIHRDFAYDPEAKIYYGPMADEVTLLVLQYELDDTGPGFGHWMVKDEQGIWHDTYEEDQKELFENG